ncbi:MAG: phosphate acyltransferase PlsX [Andreesenia angusta]|nr:phosphate acyltransferase PlsX [Andreesenia angusta]
MKIAIDLMGGDKGISSNLKGAFMALDEFKDIEIALIGREEEIKRAMENSNYENERVEIINADEVIENNEEPAMAIRRKKDSSIVIGMRALKEGKVDAFVSSGSTGALLSGGILIVKRIKGIDRPAIGFIYPKVDGNGFLLDAGANSECKAKYLYQFAIMGSIFAESILKMESPKVGLINIGEEKEKGIELYKESYRLLEESKLNFIGNVEPRYIFKSKADILVCDGFTGNMILKTLEGTADFLFGNIKSVFKKSFKSKIAGLFVKDDLKEMGKTLSYNDYGGALLLGLSKPVIKAHGSSDYIAIKNAIRQAREVVKNDISQSIEKRLLGERNEN